MIPGVQDSKSKWLFRDLERRLALIEGQVSRVLDNSEVSLAHSLLSDLDYASSGHTGFASAADLAAIGVDLTTHIADTANPHATTLEQAITAGATATSVPQFDGGIQVRGIAQGSGFSISNVDPKPMTFESAGGAHPAPPGEYGTYTFIDTGGGSEQFMRFLDQFYSEILAVTQNGNIFRQGDTDDYFIHEKSNDPVLTGTWDWTAATTVGNAAHVHVGTTAPGPPGTERMWWRTDGGPFGGGALFIDTTGSGAWLQTYFYEP